MRGLILKAIAIICFSCTAFADDTYDGITKVEIYGKLVHREMNRYYIEAKNPWPEDPYLLWLSRSEDKNRELDAWLAAHENKPVRVKGALSYHPSNTDGPKIAVGVSSISQLDDK